VAPGQNRSVKVLVALTVVAEIAATVLGWGLQPAYQPLYGLSDIVVAVVGALIVGRHRRSPVGWILLISGVQDAVLANLAPAYGLRASGEGWPLGPLAEWIGFASWPLGAVAWSLALLFVPTGHLPGPRWRLVAWTSCLGYLLYVAGWSLNPANGVQFVTGTNPYTVPGLPHGTVLAAGGCLLSAGLVGAVGRSWFGVAGPDRSSGCSSSGGRCPG